MNARYKVMLLCVMIALCIPALAPAQAAKFKLKPGAQGKICLDCHTAFPEKLKNPFIHTPVKGGECIGCHNPHAARYGKMLSELSSDICRKCHGGIVPEKALSKHKVVADGECMKCHDPHAAKNKFNLLLPVSDLCVSCHKTMGEAIAKAKFRHAPVEKGCLNCHDPHAAANAPFLLKEAAPGLCLKCHRTDKPSFASRHMNYPVERAQCTSCHDPHGSDRGALLYNNVHQPMGNRMCSQCHAEPNSPTPFATKKQGYELCRACHSSMVNEALGKNKLHWPLVSKAGCTSCHSPHAAKEAMLLKGSQLVVCGKCHEDAIERQKRSLAKHPPVLEGNCTACHSPHSSDSAFLLNQASIVDLCGSCHDWLKHSTHPIGPKVVDPRNKNLTVTCLSCHRSHGSEYKRMAYYAEMNDQCVQCHELMKR